MALIYVGNMPLELAIKKFNVQVERQQILSDWRKRSVYQKPSEIRREKKNKAIRRQMKKNAIERAREARESAK